MCICFVSAAAAAADDDIRCKEYLMYNIGEVIRQHQLTMTSLPYGSMKGNDDTITSAAALTSSCGCGTTMAFHTSPAASIKSTMIRGGHDHVQQEHYMHICIYIHIYIYIYIYLCNCFVDCGILALPFVCIYFECVHICICIFMAD